MWLRHLVVGRPLGNLGHLGLQRQTAAGALGLWMTAAAAVGSLMAAGHLRPRRRRYQWAAAQRQLGTCLPDAGCGSWFVDGGWALVLGAGCSSWFIDGGSTVTGHLRCRRRLGTCVVDAGFGVGSSTAAQRRLETCAEGVDDGSWRLRRCWVW
jgi:hypothetical protein